jgi:phosphoenolpyruvate synthase/pyruvate phosphate dikinase
VKDRSKWVLSSGESLRAPLDSVGGKAAALARLVYVGLPVPQFLVVTSQVLVEHLSLNGIDWPGSSRSAESLREQILRAPVPDEVGPFILAAVEVLIEPGGHSKVAVRSSGAEEDSASSSFAGQFTSLLSVDPSDLLEAVKACWASYLSDRSMSYRASRGIPIGDLPGFAVIVQTQIFSLKAGVLFTVHPLDPDGDSAYLEANFGTGESVVGSLATPDGMTISRSSGKVVERSIGTKRRMTSVSPNSQGSRLLEVEASLQRSPVLSDDEAEEVFEMGRRIEELQGSPQDIEWAFDSRGLWILQSRPATGLASRER